MPTSRLSFLASLGLLGVAITATGPEAAQRAIPLEDPSTIVVYHGTDRDAQLFISTGTHSRGRMARVSVKDPKGRQVAGARFGGRLGQSDFRIETPEPSLRRLKRALPARDLSLVGADHRRPQARRQVPPALLAAPDT